MAERQALIIATVAQSLVFQSPATWEYLRSQGFRLVFACGADGWESRLRQWGDVEVLPLSRRVAARSLLSAARRLRELLGDRWVFVQVQTPIAAGLVRMIRGRRSASPLIYVVHGYHFDPDRPTLPSTPARILERVLLARTDVVATVARADFNWARERCPAQRSYRLPGAGVDLDRFRPTPGELRGLSRTVIFCGELNDNKDPLFAIEVTRHLRRASADWQIVLIGDGPLAEQVSAAARQHRWVHWISHTDEVERYLTEACCLLAPSHREGLPRVMVEALGCGKPVVARSNRGSRELLSGLCPVLPPGATAGQWAHAVRQAIMVQRQPLRERAEAYSSERFVAAYAQMLDEVFELSAEAGGHQP